MPKEARGEQGGYVNEWLAKNEIAHIDMKLVEISSRAPTLRANGPSQEAETENFPKAGFDPGDRPIHTGRGFRRPHRRICYRARLLE